jgi:antitoxin PrlF
MKAIVSEKGQVTIPKAVREKLGLRPGSILELTAVGGRLVGVKKETADPFSRWMGKGKLPGNLDVDAYLKLVRG